ncbi:MAG: 2Fe-2S iron-sulfur cluster-binding protein [Acidimicrobiales bacterium]
MSGRDVTTLSGLPPHQLSAWTEAFTATGASQCGFCTPGIIMRLASVCDRKPNATTADLATSLAAHLCRCTGWRTILDAAEIARARLAGGSELAGSESAAHVPHRASELDPDAAARRATIEGRCGQSVGARVAAGLGGFADDTAPDGALVAVPDASQGWSVADTLTEARAKAGKVQGRNSGARIDWPVELPAHPGGGDWALCLQTTFVEPAYLEPDASWCEPGGVPVTPLANGGAFGGKTRTLVTEAARSLASEYGRPVRVLLNREDVVRLGPKRPPIGAGLQADGTGIVRVGWTPQSGDPDCWIDGFNAVLPECKVQVVEVPGPPVSSDPRGAGWVEAAIINAGLAAVSNAEVNEVEITSPDGGLARVSFGTDGRVNVTVDAGDVLDETVLRSYCIGAVHQGLGWVKREAIAVDASGQVLDLTIRSFGILPARDMPPVEVKVLSPLEQKAPVNASDAVFAATAAATWIAAGLAPRWPLEARGS